MNISMGKNNKPYNFTIGQEVHNSNGLQTVIVIGEPFTLQKKSKNYVIRSIRMVPVKCKECSHEYEIDSSRLGRNDVTMCKSCYGSDRIPGKRTEHGDKIYTHWYQEDFKIKVIGEGYTKKWTTVNGKEASRYLVPVQCQTCHHEYEAESFRVLNGKFKLCEECKKSKVKNNGSKKYEPQTRDDRKTFIQKRIITLEKLIQEYQEEKQTLANELADITKSELLKERQEIEKRLKELNNKENLIKELHQVSNRHELKEYVGKTLFMSGTFKHYSVSKYGKTMLVENITLDGTDVVLHHAWLQGVGRYKEGDNILTKVKVVYKKNRYFIELAV